MTEKFYGSMDNFNKNKLKLFTTNDTLAQLVKSCDVI